MSAKEFEEMDAEVIAMVNQGNSQCDTNDITEPKPETAERYDLREEKRTEDTCGKYARMNAQAAEAEAKAEKMRELLWLGLKVFLCGVAAALFLAAMLDPVWVPVLGYGGITFFLVTAAIQIDRAFWRKQHG